MKDCCTAFIKGHGFSVIVKIYKFCPECGVSLTDHTQQVDGVYCNCLICQGGLKKCLDKPEPDYCECKDPYDDGSNTSDTCWSCGKKFKPKSEWCKCEETKDEFGGCVPKDETNTHCIACDKPIKPTQLPEEITDYGHADWKKLDKDVVDTINQLIRHLRR